MTFHVRVDVTNPGQFFAACGLLELASRVEPRVQGAFERDRFTVGGAIALDALIATLNGARLDAEVTGGGAEGDMDEGDDSDDAVDRSAPLTLGRPFGLRLDWWLDRASGGRDLKVWAGTMNNVRIATAMFAALRAPEFRDEALFDVGQIVYDPENPTKKKKVEPFYFDARRAPNAHSRDVGFSPDALDLRTTAFPAVEFLCLVGLQRFRPKPIGRRLFNYCTWPQSLPIELAAPIVAGAVSVPGAQVYQFENWFRTGRRMQKAFRVAIPVAEGA